MIVLVKVVLAILVVALAAQQLVMYNNIILMGSYLTVAPIHLKIIAGLLWPLVVVVGGGMLIWFIVKFNPARMG